MLSVVLIVVSSLAFTVVMQAVAYDVRAVIANRAELSAKNGLTSGVNIVTSHMRRYGPAIAAARLGGIHRRAGDPYCDKGCWAVSFSQGVSRDINLRGAAPNPNALEVWAATIYAASKCQAEPSTAVATRVPFPGTGWWDEFDCLITDTSTLRFEPDPLPLYTLIIAELDDPCRFPPSPEAAAVCTELTATSEDLAVTFKSAQDGVLTLDTNDPTEFCGDDTPAGVMVGGAEQGSLAGSCDSLNQDTGGVISWVWDFDVHTTDDDLNLADDLTTGACISIPVLYERISGDYWAAGGVFRWATATLFSGSPSWADNHRHRTLDPATIDLNTLTDPEAVLARGTVTIRGRPSQDLTAPTLVVFAGCNIILDVTTGTNFDNVLLVAANSVWSQFEPDAACNLVPITVTGTIISGKTPFVYSPDPADLDACLGAPLDASLPQNWATKPVAYWPDRPQPWRRS